MVRIKAVVILVILLIPLFSFSMESPKNLKQYWVDMYGEVKQDESEASKIAYSIFDRMVQVADKRANRLPQLLILKNYRKFLAQSLPDGTVVISKEIPEVLKQYNAGEQILALVIGHELAHLANDDFWELYAFNDTGDGFLKIDKAKQHKKELMADSYGILYMTLAGYDTSKLMEKDKLEAIMNVLGGQAKADSLYPTSELRTEYILNGVKPIINNIKLFKAGVRLYQIGMYQDAELVFSRFLKEFPSREVYSNLGMCRYMQAKAAVKDCEGYDEYYLATGFDTETLAENFRSGKKCEGLADFKKHLAKALEYLAKAYELDKRHLNLVLNYSSALILSGDYAKAVSVLESILKEDPDNSRALNNKLIAMYLLNQQNSVDMTDVVAAKLTELSDLPEAVYNLGIIKSKDYFKEFLILEINTEYANRARKMLGMKRVYYGMTKGKIELPVPLGKVDREKTAKALKGFITTEYDYNLFAKMNIHEKGDVTAFEVDGYIVYVTYQPENMVVDDIINKLGGSYVKEILNETTLYKWQGYIAEVRSDKISKIITY